MDRRRFAGLLAAFGALAPLGVALAQQPRPDAPHPHAKDWDAMDHDQRMRAMERMRGHRHEPRYEDMRERWNGMSERQRDQMMRNRPHGQGQHGQGPHGQGHGPTR